MSPSPDVLIFGAGVIGLSLALELRGRGHRVMLTEPGWATGSVRGQASTAAAGMLAAEDPHNPPELLPLSRFSRSCYPDFLARIEALSGQAVPLQTHVTQQTMPDGEVRRLAEHSLDPRQLVPALRAAVEQSGATFTELPGEHDDSSLSAGRIVYTTGAWGGRNLPLTPRKGQMLRVRLPHDLALEEVYRAEHVYVVPRTQGPQAGTALIGATVEDAGFDTATEPQALTKLRALGATLVPALAAEEQAPAVEAWAGLRPATPDGLPLLGPWPAADRQQSAFVAAGHFRNGILLAPATAQVMADLLEDRQPTVNLSAFTPARFQNGPAKPANGQR